MCVSRLSWKPMRFSPPMHRQFQLCQWNLHVYFGERKWTVQNIPGIRVRPVPRHSLHRSAVYMATAVHQQRKLQIQSMSVQQWLHFQWPSLSLIWNHSDLHWIHCICQWTVSATCLHESAMQCSPAVHGILSVF
ncbi:hypothetical protein PENTCL1PPCAC_16844 [Pristionchus entomophagus]|uniref:G protein-coupled receptor n=1 Tax=Pristionchus entomophagus TaxID=358040 RepID=A0AAV5TK24_9BILA|nr:hypothetical protein PENTCL1PPCAC_16844 [Pristionchus entomophagus]